MKKFLIILSLAAMLAFAGCHNNANTNVNANANMNLNMATPVVRTTETATTDPAMKMKVEDALKKAGFTDVTVDTATTPATLRGTVAKGKLAEVVKVAQEAAGKPVTNQVSEK